MINFLDTNTSYDKLNSNTGTCKGKENDHPIEGFYKQFRDTFFFTYVIQYILVVLMYRTAGSGRYWKILHIASLAGLIAALCENTTIAIICNVNNNSSKVYSFFIGEFFWIITEYSIPFLNLIKMKAIAQNKVAHLINYTIYILFVPFALVRLLIGYHRMQKGYLSDEKIEMLHGVAFGIMAIADLLCTIFILYFVKRYNNRSSTNGNDLTNHIQQSSYTILIAVDIVSILLSLLYIFVTIYNKRVVNGNPILSESCVLPFHCFKSVFLLILATDALLFKYGAGANSSLRDSSGNVTTNVPNESSIRTTNNMSRISTYRPAETSNLTHTGSVGIRSPKVVSMSAFGYNPNNDIYSQTSTSRESIENLNIRNGMTSFSNDNSNNEIEIKPYPSDQFGFLHHGEYNELVFRDNFPYKQK